MLLGALYATQGLPFGFFQNALPVIYRQRGYALSLVSLGALLALPWALKFLVGPLVDRYGTRRAWLIPLQSALVVAVGALALLDPIEDLQVVLAAILVVNLVSALQDVPSDGLAVDLLPAADRGLGNGLQVAAYRAGMIVGGGLLLLVYDAIGWIGTLTALTATLILTSGVVAAFAPHARATTPDPAPYAAMLAFVRRPGVLPWLGVLAVYKAGESFGVSVLRPFLVDRGLEMTEIGAIVGVGGFFAGGVGALTGGWIAGRVGARRALVGLAGVQAVAVATYALPAGGIGGHGAVMLAAGFEHFASGMATAAVFTSMMEATRARAAATEYTVQACVVVLATILAAAASGASAERLGYPAHFLLAACACLGAVALAGRVRPPPRAA